MNNEPKAPQDPATEPVAPPSKSQLKREAQALQTLAEHLLNLPAATLAALPLPDSLRAALEETRAMRQRGARRRQKQYLGRLMREIDAAPIRAALDRLQMKEKLRDAHFQQLESFRDRIIETGDPAIEELLARYPSGDRQRLRTLARNAQRERERGDAPAASRALFRYLRQLSAD